MTAATHEPRSTGPVARIWHLTGGVRPTRRRQRRLRRAHQRNAERPRILIVGAGAGGLCAAAQLASAGYRDFTILDATDGVGGTWRLNTYPGAGCDVPSHLYSYSFDPKSDWTRRFALQPEILDYFETVARKNGLLDHLVSGVTITTARWDDLEQLWHLAAADGRRFEAEVVISACGQLNVPRFADVRGLDDFVGPTFHSARWDHDIDLTGLRVGVIGNGASAIQFVPEIAEPAAHLTVFQRSGQWIAEKDDTEYSDAERAGFQHQPWRLRLARLKIWGGLEARFLLFGPFRRLVPWLGDKARQKLDAQIPDPELRAAIEPDGNLGCRRILISNDWYRTVGRDDVSVVTTPIDHATVEGLVTETGELHELDVIIHATGFDTGAFVGGMTITGSGGRALADRWHGGASAHLGVTVPGFPNLFLLYGPNTNLGHNSIIFMIEQQVGHILNRLSQMIEAGASSIRVRPEVAEASDRRMQERLRKTVFVDRCRSWYTDATGRVTNNWSDFTTTYWFRMNQRRDDDYLLEWSRADLSRRGPT